MDLLTPELICLSSLQNISSTAIVTVTRQLDFNLSRRSGIVINQIVSSMIIANIGGVQYFLGGCQELDLDPDNVLIWQNNITPSAVEYDSSRLLRHIVGGTLNEVATLAWVAQFNAPLIKQWHDVPLERRPISMTPVRHHLASVSNVADSVIDGQLAIYYHIVELSLTEIGILNASRR